MAYSGKPISLYPMKFDDAVSALLKVKPKPKAKPTKKKSKVKKKVRV
jgi:hypothetical protein